MPLYKIIYLVGLGIIAIGAFGYFAQIAGEERLESSRKTLQSLRENLRERLKKMSSKEHLTIMRFSLQLLPSFGIALTFYFTWILVIGLIILEKVLWLPMLFVHYKRLLALSLVAFIVGLAFQAWAVAIQ